MPEIDNGRNNSPMAADPAKETKPGIADTDALPPPLPKETAENTAEPQANSSGESIDSVETVVAVVAGGMDAKRPADLDELAPLDPPPPFVAPPPSAAEAADEQGPMQLRVAVAPPRESAAPASTMAAAGAGRDKAKRDNNGFAPDSGGARGDAGPGLDLALVDPLADRTEKNSGGGVMLGKGRVANADAGAASAAKADTLDADESDSNVDSMKGFAGWWGWLAVLAALSIPLLRPDLVETLRWLGERFGAWSGAGGLEEVLALDEKRSFGVGCFDLLLAVAVLARLATEVLRGGGAFGRSLRQWAGCVWPGMLLIAAGAFSLWGWPSGGPAGALRDGLRMAPAVKGLLQWAEYLLVAPYVFLPLCASPAWRRRLLAGLGLGLTLSAAAAWFQAPWAAVYSGMADPLALGGLAGNRHIYTAVAGLGLCLLIGASGERKRGRPLSPWMLTLWFVPAALFLLPSLSFGVLAASVAAVTVAWASARGGAGLMALLLAGWLGWWGPSVLTALPPPPPQARAWLAEFAPMSGAVPGEPSSPAAPEAGDVPQSTDKAEEASKNNAGPTAETDKVNDANGANVGNGAVDAPAVGDPGREHRRLWVRSVQSWRLDPSRPERGEQPTMRYRRWAGALNMALAHPVNGVGLGQYDRHIQDYIPVSPARARTDDAGAYDLSIDEPLSFGWFFTLAGELGILGLAAWGIMLAELLARAAGLGRRGRCAAAGGVLAATALLLLGGWWTGWLVRGAGPLCGLLLAMSSAPADEDDVSIKNIRK